MDAQYGQTMGRKQLMYSPEGSLYFWAGRLKVSIVSGDEQFLKNPELP